MSISGKDTLWFLVIILVAICIFIVILLRKVSRRSDSGMAIPPAFIVRTIAGFQFLISPVSEAKGLVPSSFPPIEIVRMNSPYPGTILFSNATNPFRDDSKGNFDRYIAEIDKYTGRLLRYRRILTKAYVFQPQLSGYSYGILEKVGVNGAGHDGTHYLTDRNLRRKCSCNEFTFLNDPLNGFSHQHNASILPNGNLLLFDNGTLHGVQKSRAVEYSIDEEKRFAELVWSYSNNQFTHAQGSVERLPNGNTLIGWGFATAPFVSEVTFYGRVVLEMNLPEGQIVYRVYQGNKSK